MKKFKSLSKELRAHYEKTYADLPDSIKKRLQTDFYSLLWDKLTPKERSSRAEQWDFENDPGKREVREGLAAITDPESPAYSATETRKLRGDFLPEKKKRKVVKLDSPPLEFDSADCEEFKSPSEDGLKVRHTHNTGSSDRVFRNNKTDNFPEEADSINEKKHNMTDKEVQDFRLKLCLEAGLRFDSPRMPRGLNKVAETLGISRQALAKSINPAIIRMKERIRAGKN